MEKDDPCCSTGTIKDTSNQDTIDTTQSGGTPPKNRPNHTRALNRKIHEQLLKILAPDGTEYVTMESIKNMVKIALGNRFTDDEIKVALRDLGFPRDEPIHYRVFLSLISAPITSAVGSIDEKIGSWMTTEEWREAMSRVGIELTPEEVEKAVDMTKEKFDRMSRKVTKDETRPLSATSTSDEDEGVSNEESDDYVDADEFVNN